MARLNPIQWQLGRVPVDLHTKSMLVAFPTCPWFRGVEVPGSQKKRNPPSISSRKNTGDCVVIVSGYHLDIPLSPALTRLDPSSSDWVVTTKGRGVIRIPSMLNGLPSVQKDSRDHRPNAITHSKTRSQKTLLPQIQHLRSCNVLQLCRWIHQPGNPL